MKFHATELPTAALLSGQRRSSRLAAEHRSRDSCSTDRETGGYELLYELSAFARCVFRRSRERALKTQMDTVAAFSLTRLLTAPSRTVLTVGSDVVTRSTEGEWWPGDRRPSCGQCGIQQR